MIVTLIYVDLANYEALWAVCVCYFNEKDWLEACRNIKRLNIFMDYTKLWEELETKSSLVFCFVICFLDLLFKSNPLVELVCLV